jgi:hypothetical protein
MLQKLAHPFNQYIARTGDHLTTFCVYQIHLAYGKGHGPDYGHFVSKDFINWAPMPVAIWNGIDSSVTPFKETKYDNEAIFTGSAVLVDGAGPGGKGLGVVNIYPGLCNKGDWPACASGTLLAQAVPADYSDALLTNWSKPSYNPIIESTQVELKCGAVDREGWCCGSRRVVLRIRTHSLSYTLSYSLSYTLPHHLSHILSYACRNHNMHILII